MNASATNPPEPSTRHPEPSPESPPRPERLRYAPPRLTQYGRVDEITKAVGRRGRKDSHGGRGGGRQRRTGF